MASNAKKALKQAETLARKGRASEAADLYRRIAAAFPLTAEGRQAQAALRTLGPGQDPAAELRLLYAKGQFAALIEAAARLPAKQKRLAIVQTLLGGAEMALGRPDRAEAAFRALLKADPGRPAAHNNLGLALRAQAKLPEAEKAFRQALKLRPDYGDAQNGLGMVLQDSGDIAGAQRAFQAAVRLKPDDPEIWTNLGNMHQQQGDLDSAIAAYERALQIAPEHGNAHYNYGLALKAKGRLSDAIDHYRAAAKARPNFAPAHNNLGNALRAMGQLPAAEEALRRAVKLTPQDAEAHANLGVVLQAMGQFDEAVAAFEASRQADPNNAAAEAARLHLLAQMCDWRVYPEFAAQADRLGIVGPAVVPFGLLSLEDAPERQLRRSERYARETFGPSAAPMRPPAEPRQPKRLRIGYFSGDFRSHPVARLIAGTFAAHDKTRVELFGYSFGPDRDDAFRADLSAPFDHFHDIRATPDGEAAQVIAEDKLDIAVDLTLYTQHSRTALFAKRIAPVQINYLGYPGTSGASFMDYMIADPIVVPPEQEAGVSEAIIRLPHCYQPNDNRRPVPDDTQSRADHGLPETGFVFCSFNSAYKITPREFDIWMRVLQARPGSVLWLLESTKWTRDNLVRQAKMRGMDPTRLVFAPRVSNDAHLARHHHADLFIDTFAYNAHTTGSDALWMGLPVVTMVGRQFAARVCASLLHAVGMPELVTENEADYEALIMDLSGDPDKLAGLKRRLAAGRASVPLFDTEGHTRALETAYETAHHRWRSGQEPAGFTVNGTDPAKASKG
jgi:protein O-GlcNAc transferase